MAISLKSALSLAGSPARRAGLVSLIAIAAAGVAAPMATTVASADSVASASASDLSAYTTGNGNIYVVVTLRDAAMAPVAGKTVNMNITPQRGKKVDRNVTVTGANVTDANGQVFFTLSSTRTVYDYGKAVDATDGVTLPQQLLVDLPTATY